MGTPHATIPSPLHDKLVSELPREAMAATLPVIADHLQQALKNAASVTKAMPAGQTTGKSGK